MRLVWLGRLVGPLTIVPVDTSIGRGTERMSWWQSIPSGRPISTRPPSLPRFDGYSGLDCTTDPVARVETPVTVDWSRGKPWTLTRLLLFGGSLSAPANLSYNQL